MKQIIAVILFSILALTASAQFNLGIKGGLNYSNIEEEIPGIGDAFDARTAYHIGLFSTIDFHEKWSLGIEAIYSFEGGKFSSTITNLEEITGHVDYINVPVIIRFQPLEFLFLEAGIEPGFLVNESNSLVFDKTLEIGGLLGAGANIGAHWMLNLRYIQGFTALYDINFTDINGDVVNDTGGKNKMLQLSLGYKLFE